MERQPAGGRTLWLTVVTIVAAFVLADFVRSPLLPGSGADAIPSPRLTLWVPAAEGGGASAQVAQAAAAGLELSGRPTVVKRLRGGTSEAVAAFLARPVTRRGADLLVLGSATMTALARDEADRIVPGAAGHALEAKVLLRHSPSIGLLSRERLKLAAQPGSGIDGDAALVRTIRTAPASAVFAIPDDGWSRSRLAALVEAVGRGGTVPFVPYDADELAARARADGLTNLVLASRGVLAADLRKGRLRPLAWPVDGRRPPASWVALVAPASSRPAQVAELRGWVDQLNAEPRWRAHLRAHGRTPGGPWNRTLTRMVRREAGPGARGGAGAAVIARRAR
ncbi:MAG TPA: hypothetical protein VMF55_12915 [Solirubrobacterales bacterium]|nr:hypothetical protein [Solirubrobacterales bacterium]